MVGKNRVVHGDLHIDLIHMAQAKMATDHIAIVNEYHDNPAYISHTHLPKP
jgi:hypothetical protein